MPERQFHFSVKAFILKDGNFLVLQKKKRAKENVWDLPGGKMEFGETAEQTLAREVFEEIGCMVAPTKVLDTWNYIEDKRHITGIFYLCRMTNDKIQLSDEHVRFQWVNAQSETSKIMCAPFEERMAKWNWDAILDEKLAI
ncbi:MAG: mismatch repair protein MutT [Firmicutes bacterium]|nr:mismatch repair protein MutT [Bacillota bacterium]